jgi:phosphoribosylformylglycinamidine synthase
VSGRQDAALFGEGQSRIVISCPPGRRGEIEALAGRQGVPFTHLGRAGGDRLVIGDLLSVPVADLARAYREGLPRALQGR